MWLVNSFSNKVKMRQVIMMEMEFEIVNMGGGIKQVFPYPDLCYLSVLLLLLLSLMLREVSPTVSVSLSVVSCKRLCRVGCSSVASYCSSSVL